MNPLPSTLVASVVAAAIAGIASPATAQAPRFYDDDPIWVEPVTQEVTRAAGFEPSISYSYLANFRREG